MSVEAGEAPESKTVEVNGQPWPARLDTQAEISVISEPAARELNLVLDDSR